MAPIQGPPCCPQGIKGYGDPTHGVIIVGIAPGRDEATRSKQPFTGPSGQLMDACLKGAGWHRDKVYATNLLCWFNNTPTQDQIEECAPRLRTELDRFKPKLIITAGALANEAVTGAKRRKGSRGSVNWSDRFKCYILDTHHPSYALQAQDMSAVQDLLRDFSKIPRVLEWGPDSEPAHVEYHVCETLAEAQAVLNWLPPYTSVAIDIETSNPDVETIDAYSDQLLTFAISYYIDGCEHNVVFPKRLFTECVRNGTHVQASITAGGCPCGQPTYVLIFPDNVLWLFQAGQNDIPGIRQYFGQTLPLCGDTMLMSVCADERPGYHGLKPNGREWLAAGWWEEKVKPYYKGKMHLLADTEVELYNAKDSAYTRRLEPVHAARMHVEGTDGLYRNVLLPAMQTFIDMQIRGINIDQKRLHELAYDDWFPDWQRRWNSLQKEAQEIGWPTADFNMNSSQQLSKLLFKIIGLEPLKFTPGGAASVDKEVLDRLDHPYAAKIRAFRKLDTIVDYVFAVQRYLKHDGLLHPSAFLSTTRTGRTSYRDPAMQTIPRSSTLGDDYARLREIVIPHNPDTHCIVEADVQQIEVWLAWANSRDPVLLEHLQAGDVHSATAEGAFNTTRDRWTPLEWQEKRQNAKKIRFGLQYGEGAEKLSSPPPVGIGCSVAQARRYITNFWSTYPKYRQWYDGVQQEALEKGYLTSPTGRIMHFPLVLDHRALRQAVNFLIQSPASDCNLISMIELAPLLAPLDSYIILNIHDSLVVEASRRHLGEVIAVMRTVMERPKFDGYPQLKVDVRVGDNFGGTHNA